MADSISVQNLKDAKVDAGDLAEFTNGEDNQTVTSRLGKQYPSIAKLVKDFNTEATSRLNANDATALLHLNANDATALSHLNANDATALAHLNANDATAANQIVEIQSAADAVLASIGYTPPVAYIAGLSMTNQNQTVQYNGQTYAPKVGDLPFTTSGTFETAKFRLIQGVSGADLAAAAGLPAYAFTALEMQSILDNALPMQNYTALNAYNGRAKSVKVTAKGIAGNFLYDSSASNIGNGGTSFAHASGTGAWIRLYTGPVDFGWFQPVAGQDNSAKWNAAVNTGNKKVITTGSHKIGLTVFVPVGVEIICDPRNTTFSPVSITSGVGNETINSLTDGFMFMWNTIDGVNQTVEFPNMNSGGISGAHFVNTDGVLNAKICKAFCSWHGRNLKSNGFTQSFVRAEGFYIDSYSLIDVLFENIQNNTDYQVDLRSLGDGLYLRDLHFVFDRSNGITPLAVRVRGARGAVIECCIGGDYIFEQSDAVKVVGCHFEQAQHIVDTSSVDYDSTDFYPSNRIPVIIRASYLSSDVERHEVTTRKVQFVFVEGALLTISGVDTPLFQWEGSHFQVSSASTLKMESTYLKWTADGAVNKSQLFGVRIEESGGAALTAWNSNRYALSRSGAVLSGSSSTMRVTLDHAVKCTDTAFAGLATDASTGLVTVSNKSVQWLIATGTYYYKAAIIYDTGRLLGKPQGNGEFSINVTSVDKMVRLFANFGSIPKNCILRLYRGTSSGSYDKFVDLHTLGTDHPYDNGLRVCGQAWQNRTAGAVDGLNSAGVRHIRYRGDNIDVLSDNQPTVGTWTRGDRVTKLNSTIDINNMLLSGHHRLTTGSTNNNVIDWASMYVSTVSPAT